MFHLFSFQTAISPPLDPVEEVIIELAVVLQPIKPNYSGLIEYEGRCWNARCALPITLIENTPVQVVGDYGIFLLVIPFNHL
ncbi:MAG: hypothetical protein WBB82_01855 [Limnothrix sp.]